MAIAAATTVKMIELTHGHILGSGLTHRDPSVLLVICVWERFVKTRNIIFKQSVVPCVKHTTAKIVLK